MVNTRGMTKWYCKTTTTNGNKNENSFSFYQNCWWFWLCHASVDFVCLVWIIEKVKTVVVLLSSFWLFQFYWKLSKPLTWIFSGGLGIDSYLKKKWHFIKNDQDYSVLVSVLHVSCTFWRTDTQTNMSNYNTIQSSIEWFIRMKS